MLDRFVIAIESIAASLAVIAKNSDKPANVTVVEQSRPVTAGADKPSQAAPAATKGADAKPAAKPADKPAAKPDTKPATSAPSAEADYEPLKAATIQLANAGSEGKAAAINILTKYGVKKAIDAPKDKWPAMIEDMNSAFAELQGEGDIA